jgi:hypothetical protein
MSPLILVSSPSLLLSLALECLLRLTLVSPFYINYFQEFTEAEKQMKNT